jgi:hypothetical protein
MLSGWPDKEQSPGWARALSGSGTEGQRQGMVRRLRVGFTVGHWVTSARTLPNKEKKDNTREVNRG